MSKKPIVQKIEQSVIKQDITPFRVGDTVAVHTRIIEGEKERTQVFQGTVIARKGSGASETFSLHRIAYGEGMERVFQLHSPRISKIDVVKEGDVRPSKLYRLRGTFGKKARVKGRIGPGRRAANTQEAVAVANAVEPEAVEVASAADDSAPVTATES